MYGDFWGVFFGGGGGGGGIMVFCFVSKVNSSISHLVIWSLKYLCLNAIHIIYIALYCYHTGLHCLISVYFYSFHEILEEHLRKHLIFSITESSIKAQEQ